ncbi:MAG: hypothetical protein JXA30_17380 [Deltaproteobacteria bacterium]|nr:hypothetical protein [Deltaproteobacteria bacterium]
MISRVFAVVAAAFFICIFTACDIDLPRVSEITDTRVLGTRIELPEDPSLVWPIPGESARISWKVVFPALGASTDTLESMFIVCTPAPVSVTTPLCLEFFSLMDKRKGAQQDLSQLIGVERLTCADLEQAKRERPELLEALPIDFLCVEGEPSYEIEIPEDPAQDELLILGILCDKGKAFVDITRTAFFGCELKKGGQEIPVVFYVPLQDEDDPPNHHPRLDNAEFRINGRAWPQVLETDLLKYLLDGDSNDERFDCLRAVDERAVLGVAAENQVFSLLIEYDSLEEYRVRGERQSEELTIAHYATSGKLNRDSSIIRSEWEVLGFDLEWEPPEEIPKNGLLTRVFFTVRDGRGGFDSAMRAFCVTR